MLVHAPALLLLLASPGHAEALRVVVRAGEDGLVVEDAAVVPGGAPTAAPEGTEGEVLDGDGRVLLRVRIPDPRWREMPDPAGGSGVAVRLDRAVAAVRLPWPEGAARLRVGGAEVRPRAGLGGGGGTAEPMGENGDPAERIDVLFLGDGYTADEMDEFAADAEAALEHMESIEPLTAFTEVTNGWIAEVVSAESGVDHPEADPPVERDTALGCSYGCAGLDRLICCDDDAVLAAAAAAFPEADQIVVLVNDDTYGGAGSWTYAVAYTGRHGPPAVIHEVGHSLFRLWDEYSYGFPYNGAVDGPNCAHDPEAPPWDEWLGDEGVDVYAGCSYTNYYRPTASDCMMYALMDHFGPVCRQEATLRLHEVLGPTIVAVDPPEGPVASDGSAPLALSAELLPVDGLAATWRLDGEVVGEGSSVELAACGPSGTLALEVEHETEWVRDDPTGLLSDSASWTLERPPCPEDTAAGDTAAGEGDTTAGGAGNGDGDEPAAGCGCASGAAPGAGGLLAAFLAMVGATTRRGRGGPADPGHGAAPSRPRAAQHRLHRRKGRRMW